MLKTLISVFVLAFVLNWAWEIAHSVLYAHYRGGSITPFVLFRAALGDAGIILTLVFIARKLKLNTSIFVAVLGVVTAVGIEIWALQEGKWAYSSLMPVIPIIKTGLTPTVQLAVTGYVAQKLSFRKN